MSDGTTKKKILCCNFAEKLVLENGRVATSKFTEPIQFIINASEVLGGSQKKQEVNSGLLCRLVRSGTSIYFIAFDFIILLYLIYSMLNKCILFIRLHFITFD